MSFDELSALCTRFGRRLGDVVRETFNAKSAEIGSPIKLEGDDGYIAELENALETCHEYLDSLLRPCKRDCDCILHMLEKILDKPDSRGVR